jgi:hypothetical protein
MEGLGGGLGVIKWILMPEKALSVVIPYPTPKMR